ncbi:phage holin family protein [Occultella glacieicola]|uniref:Phage holin family protein n=1 Tax=Occultella glacieicola TaxID=2518684 RepID=A0ABY2E0V4_9MICO|nr:phage holin family protein [Occultella glacieicola]TDE91553.1 phage holin family protein [Occultella glacieicola]
MTASHSPDPRDERSVGELFGEVSKDLSTLIRQEVALAKAEVQESAKRAGKGAGMLGGAAWASNFLLLFLSLALWWAIGAMIGDGDDVPALGWSALIVAGIWAVVAAVLALLGRKSLESVEGIPQTADTVKRIPDALKGQQS